MNGLWKKIRSTIDLRDKWAHDVKIRRQQAFVAETTNGQEGLHHHFNRVTSDLRSTLTRWTRVLKLVYEKSQHLTLSVELNAQRKIDAMAAAAKWAVVNGANPRQYQKEKCECGKRVMYQAIYADEFPCQCNILTYIETKAGETRWKPRHEVQFPTPYQELTGEHVTVMTINDMTGLGIDTTDGWSFSSKREGPIAKRCRFGTMLEMFGWEEKFKSIFRVWMDEAKKCGYDSDDAAWEVVRFCWRHNLVLKDMSAHKLISYNHLFVAKLRGEENVPRVHDVYLQDLDEHQFNRIP